MNKKIGDICVRSGPSAVSSIVLRIAVQQLLSLVWRRFRHKTLALVLKVVLILQTLMEIMARIMATIKILK